MKKVAGHIALYQPEIPQNVGTLIRLSACLDIPLDIIHPCGFLWDKKYIKRSMMDYYDHAQIFHHEGGMDAFLNTYQDRRIILVDVQGDYAYDEFSYEAGDILLMGQESSGVPQSVFDRLDHRVYIPIQNRSLNVAVACAIVAGEMARQTGAYDRFRRNKS